MTRYFRLYAAFVRTGFQQELSFRGNFLIRVGTELLWFAVLCVFYEVIFRKTNKVADWTQWEYLILVGTHFIMTGLIETFFMPNFNELSEKVRSGKLDFALAKPVDEQFLLTMQSLDWATFTNVAYGLGMIVFSLVKLGVVPTAGQVAIYVVTLASGVALFYSMMTMLAVTAVWLIRNQHLYEMWFYVNIFGRFPPEVFEGPLGSPLRWITTFVLPLLIAVSVPAQALSNRLDRPWLAAYSVAAAVVFLALSRVVFRGALRHYRSASS